MLKRRVPQPIIDNLVTHMITQEFGDRGAWGGNLTDAIYLIAALQPEDQKLFLNNFLQQMSKELQEVLTGGSLTTADAERAVAEFEQFNPQHCAGYHFGFTCQS